MAQASSRRDVLLSSTFGLLASMCSLKPLYTSLVFLIPALVHGYHVVSEYTDVATSNRIHADDAESEGGYLGHHFVDTEGDIVVDVASVHMNGIAPSPCSRSAAEAAPTAGIQLFSSKNRWSPLQRYGLWSPGMLPAQRLYEDAGFGEASFTEWYENEKPIYTGSRAANEDKAFLIWTALTNKCTVTTYADPGGDWWPCTIEYADGKLYQLGNRKGERYPVCFKGPCK